MSLFDELVKPDTPRFVVMYRRAPNGDEQFEWGIVGGLPVMTLIGFITRCQLEMMEQRAEDNECPQSAFVVSMHDGTMLWWVHRDIPVDPLVGMLEVIKANIIQGRVAQAAASQRRILGPDGTPFPRN